ncbi:aldehyde dehydrogenase (NADP(+)) [Amycolatopsis acidiphila]|uniref:Aldehyde dehydrogenase (NADP(+)) n=1 Tax=Amycolatopsis acidiphila TaxID=715473 RepID=A0A558AM74_9PSEU|nr:aldehyde dehydrogenase (NADP(+)) [Amycolatopsis acidiphila]TVT25368.1 aldehyde dehydrogenase (NADP(+)) [Amycolatopsis acidiphila]UIJ62500.1 aldehyde dehydrogenase (NADP(+)) [Amycolatopsis acidiphila]GHG83965.1 aldehyde dehydrogenase [Amycolatopsis acidiphila]
MPAPASADTTCAEYEKVLATAQAAAPVLAAMPLTERAGLLRAVAGALRTHEDELVPRADTDSSLGVPRLAGEVERTAGQLEMFADAVEEGSWLEAIIDRADASAPRPDLRRMLIPLGPVAVFGASNFPFAFGLAGGDTASALAAGCPVVAKAHPAQPRLSGAYARVVIDALRAAGAPEGTFAVVHGMENGRKLVTDARIAAVAFTGSTAGGRALADLAAARPSPIPFYGELGSLNPVFVTREAARVRGKEIVGGFLASMSLGGGQFCTKPGVLFVPAGYGLEDLIAAEAATAPMRLLHKGIGTAFRAEAARLAAHPAVQPLSVPEQDAADEAVVRPVLVSTTATELARHPGQLLVECFGPFALVVAYTDDAEPAAAADLMDGNLTATVHGEPSGDAAAPALLRTLTGTAGRVIWNGWPTGVTVGWAQHHGGPYPATTSVHTSVGVTAMRRFLRPVAYQSVPDAFLPPALRDANDLRIPRRVDGALTAAPVTAPG